MFIFGPDTFLEPFVNGICNDYYLGVEYIVFIALTGAGLMLVDLARVISSGPRLPESLNRSRIFSGCVVTEECERDLKLLSVVFTLEFFLLMLAAIVMCYPVLLLPWLIMTSIQIFLEFVLLFLNITRRSFCNSIKTLFIWLIALFNWWQVYCFFCVQMGYICEPSTWY